MLHISPWQQSPKTWDILFVILFVSKITYVIWYSYKYLCYILLVLLIFSKRNVKVYLHKPDQFLNLNGRMGYKIHINESIQNQVNIQDIR